MWLHVGLTDCWPNLEGTCHHSTVWLTRWLGVKKHAHSSLIHCHTCPYLERAFVWDLRAHIAVIVLHRNKGHIPGGGVTRSCHRSIHRREGFVPCYLFCAHFLHLHSCLCAGLAVYISVCAEEGHSGFMPWLALLTVGIPKGFSC